MYRLIGIIALFVIGFVFIRSFRNRGRSNVLYMNVGCSRWLGAGVGFAFAGPLGAIIGFALGSLLGGRDYSKADVEFMGDSPRQQDFSASLLVLSAAVMKANGNVKKSELEFVKRFFLNNFGQEQAEKYILTLREILKQDINLYDVCQQIGRYMNYSSKLQLLHYLFGIALADGLVDDMEIGVINTISGYIGLSSYDFESIKAMFVKKEDDSYAILGITSSATDEEVKKAYREMAKKNHPDKVAYLGEDVRKAAEKKFQEINDAYDKIKKQRGMN